MEIPNAEAVEVRSADGTTLAAGVMGEGSPMLLVHGASVGSDEWMELPRLLAAEHTVWYYDRRGRGRSGDTEPYEFAREIDDLRAVLAAIGQPAHLLGHSFGAVCSLRAAAAGASLLSLVLYEPPVHVSRFAAAVERVVTLFNAGDPDGALTTFFCDVAGEPRDEVESFRANAEAWGATVARTDTVVREISALAQRTWDARDYQAIKAPVLHIAGGLTESAVYAKPEEIAEALPHASFVTIPEQGHVAFAYDPEGFAEVVLRFTR